MADDGAPLDEERAREVVQDEVESVSRTQVAEAVAERLDGVSRRDVLSLLAGSAAGAGLTLASTGGARAATAPYVGEPGAPLNALYTASIKDTNDNLVIDLPAGGPIDLKNRLNLPKFSSDPAASAGDVWYRDDLD